MKTKNKILIMSLTLFTHLVICAQTNTRLVGNKSYELSNHLGNVLEVATDRKVDKNTESEVVAFNDYYPYGMLMEGRHGKKDKSNYRFAFQGQEKDDGIKGAGNSYNYTYRMHDSRLGRFFAVDPLASKYAEISTYASFSNSPNAIIDSDGREIKVSYHYDRKMKQSVYTITVTGKLINNSEVNYSQAELECIAERISKGIKERFTGSGDEYVWKTETEIVVAENEDDIKKEDHVFRIYDHGKLPNAYPDGKKYTSPTAAGHAPPGENIIELSTEIVDRDIMTEDGRFFTLEQTAAHELGHSAGLDHIKKGKQPGNLMHSGTSKLRGDEITESQIKGIRRRYNNQEINKGKQKIEINDDL